MSAREPDAERARGSILLPVIVVLLLVASAATAMTLQVRTSLREAATRRDRLALGYLADAVVRSSAAALVEASETQGTPPFALDGTPQGCGLPGGGRLVFAVQDEGGLVDLNKGARELLLLVLQRAGLSGWDTKRVADAIARRRDPEGTSPVSSSERGAAASPGAAGFSSVDQIDGLPGVTATVSERLRPAFTVASGSAGVDPILAGPGLRALVSRKDLTDPTLSEAVAPSSHTAFTVTATAMSRQGTRVQRRGTLKIERSGSSNIQFTSWEAPVGFESLADIANGSFCVRIAAALAPG